MAIFAPCMQDNLCGDILLSSQECAQCGHRTWMSTEDWPGNCNATVSGSGDCLMAGRLKKAQEAMRFLHCIVVGKMISWAGLIVSLVRWKEARRLMSPHPPRPQWRPSWENFLRCQRHRLCQFWRLSMKRFRPLWIKCASVSALRILPTLTYWMPSRLWTTTFHVSCRQCGIFVQCKQSAESVHGQSSEQQNSAISVAMHCKSDSTFLLDSKIVHALVQRFVCFERKSHFQDYCRNTQQAQNATVIDLTWAISMMHMPINWCGCGACIASLRVWSSVQLSNVYDHHRFSVSH